MRPATSATTAALVFAVLLCAAPAPAQAPNPPAAKPSAPKPAALPAEKPYAPLALTMRNAPDDPSLTAFRNELVAAAKGRVFSDLARLVVPRGFFWDRDFGGAFDPKRPGAENFATAIRLERAQNAGWNALLALAAETVAAKVPARPGVVCVPARPEFDEIKFDRLMETTGSEPIDWRYPLSDAVEMRAAPRLNAPVTEKLGRHLVRALSDEAAVLPDGWTRVAAPSGRTGFVAPGGLSILNGEQICYAKDITGRWRIAGYIGGGD
ncbi:MAG: SH3 domain-containing protein [Hyphomicrobiales bacterium]